MAQPFKEQGGAATMDPNPFVRWATSKFVSSRCSYAATERKRARAESRRQSSGARHQIEYFHQVDDGYSHLAAQLLRPLLERYDVDLTCHVVRVRHDQNLPEPDLLDRLSRHDSAAVAPHYGLHFPAQRGRPSDEDRSLAERILAGTDGSAFPDVAPAVGEALWTGDRSTLEALAERHGAVEPADADQQIEAAMDRRAKLHHYSSAMFHYAGEWFWGADRFYHLEQLLGRYGARKDGTEELICPRPAIESGPLRDDGRLTFEIYPSLRSPYTSMIFDRAVKLAQDTGVKMVVRPVLPMVMRGVPATLAKGQYIFSDTAREAAALGVPWGKMYDPIGQPTRNAYSLWPWAREKGRGVEFLSSFLRAAFADGVNTNRIDGLRSVVENAGLPWSEAEGLLGNVDWEDELEQNRLAMYDFGCWGVPSFRILDESGRPTLALWGQDRLWLFSREIQRLLAARGT